MVLARGRANLSSRSSSQTRRENHLQTRLLIAEIAEQDMVRENAPRMGKLAAIAKRQNHFQNMCRSRKKVHGLEEETKEHHSNKNLFVGAVTTKVEVQSDEYFVMLPVEGRVTRLKLDTGSQVNILPVEELKKVIGSNPCMDPCTHKLVSYSDDKLTVLGTRRLPVEFKANVEKELTFHLVHTNQPGLLGLRSAQDLGLIKVVMMTNVEEEQAKLDVDVKSDKSLHN